jgi:hypothetical protein
MERMCETFGWFEMEDVNKLRRKECRGVREHAAARRDITLAGNASFAALVSWSRGLTLT